MCSHSFKLFKTDSCRLVSALHRLRHPATWENNQDVVVIKEQVSIFGNDLVEFGQHLVAQPAMSLPSVGSDSTPGKCLRQFLEFACLLGILTNLG